ncbi:MAG: indole-3-glycerol-phosphate synthase [Candidatus Hydrothermarchaeales archaeon]
MNFNTILKDCRERFKGFDREIEIERKPKSFEKTILETSNSGLNPIIGEIKFSSPLDKVGRINDPVQIAQEMVEGGACGISVLTEEKFFRGSLENLRQVAPSSPVPVLRKDFIFDESQIYESYYYGADSLLLISSFFDGDKLRSFIDKSREIGMEPLVEIHSPKDVEIAKKAGTKIYVINNRDKDTLKIDLNRSKILSGYINDLKISASGISTPKDLSFVLRYCDAALIGTSIMKSKNIKEKVKGLVHGR